MGDLKVGARIASFFSQATQSISPKQLEQSRVQEGFIPLGTQANNAESAESRSIRGSRAITVRDYAAIATLKVAGRQVADIARAYGVSETQIRPHVARAMAEYRKGKLKLDSTELRKESEAVAEQKNTSFNNRVADAAVQSTAVNDFSAEILSGSSTDAALPTGQILNIIA